MIKFLYFILIYTSVQELFLIPQEYIDVYNPTTFEIEDSTKEKYNKRRLSRLILIVGSVIILIMLLSGIFFCINGCITESTTNILIGGTLTCISVINIIFYLIWKFFFLRDIKEKDPEKLIYYFKDTN